VAKDTAIAADAGRTMNVFPELDCESILTSVQNLEEQIVISFQEQWWSGKTTLAVKYCLD